MLDDAAFRTAGKWMARKAALSIIITSVAVALLGPFILGRFAGTIEQRAGRDESIPALAQFCIDRPFAISALVVPACIVGLILWTNPPGRWLLMLLGYALLLIPFGMLLYSVIMLLAGLYSPQPL
jgi:hypothetical protein